MEHSGVQEEVALELHRKRRYPVGRHTRYHIAVWRPKAVQAVPDRVVSERLTARAARVAIDARAVSFQPIGAGARRNLTEVKRIGAKLTLDIQSYLS